MLTYDLSSKNDIVLFKIQWGQTLYVYSLNERIVRVGWLSTVCESERVLKDGLC